MPIDRKRKLDSIRFPCPNSWQLLNYNTINDLVHLINNSGTIHSCTRTWLFIDEFWSSFCDNCGGLIFGRALFQRRFSLSLSWYRFSSTAQDWGREKKNIEFKTYAPQRAEIKSLHWFQPMQLEETIPNSLLSIQLPFFFFDLASFIQLELNSSKRGRVIKIWNRVSNLPLSSDDG